MAVLLVPPPAPPGHRNPSLGRQLAHFIESRLVFGPGSLQKQPAKLDPEKRGLLYSAYEVFPDREGEDRHPHPFAGGRVFERVSWELRKGLAKTEFAAWVTALEIHPESPVRFDHWAEAGEVAWWDENYVYHEGEPVGRPVVAPFIPMLATGEEQVQELAYGVLHYVLSNCPDAELFDIGYERIVRLGERGENDGEAKAVSNAPNQRDGARTTFQHFDEPHRIYLPRAKEAVDTMMNNMGKRVLEEPWTLATSTAGKPGQGSVQEDIRSEAEKIARHEIDNPRFFFFSRWADNDKHPDLSTVEKREAAVADATGPVGEWGRGQFNRIARDYEREGGDKEYWEQVWLNRWRKAGSQTFNVTLIRDFRLDGYVIPDGAFVAGGFDGARRQDSTAMVLTEIDTGAQQLIGLWEKPKVLNPHEPSELENSWEVPELEVTAHMEEARNRWELWQMWCDPPYWTDTIASWATLYPDQVYEFWTNQYKRMAYAIRAYNEALERGAARICGLPYQVEDMLRHMGSAGKKELNLVDDKGIPLSIMSKMEGRLSEKFDGAMAGCISWTATLDCRRKGVRPQPKVGMPTRIR